MGKLTKAEKKAKKQAKKDSKMAKAKSVKWIPLIIVIALITALILCTDLILTTGIRLVSQSAFGAKCDIEKVHLDFMHSSLEIYGFRQGDPSRPMQNLFQFDSMICDIDINQLLSRHFAIDEMTLSGLELKTPRDTSAYIEPKAKKDKKKPEKNTEPATPILPDFDYSGILKTLTERITAGVLNVLPVTDAQQLMDSLKNDLQTPEKTEAAKDLTKTLTDKWQKETVQLTEDVTSFSKKAQAAQTISLNKNSSIQDIQSAVTQLTELYKEGDALQKKIRTDYNEVQKDSKKINSSLTALTKAVDTDKKMIQTSVQAIAREIRFTPAFFNDIASSVWTSVVREAGPYIEKGKKILSIVSGEKSDAKPKKEPRKRLSGSTYTWGAEYPDVSIGKLHFSGMGYTGEVLSVSSNQQITGKPTTAQITHEKTGGIQDSISLCLDTRGKTYAEDQFIADVIWNTPIELHTEGTFNATLSGSTIQFAYGADETARFTANGAFTDVSMYPPKTGQATIDRILTKSLTDIETVSAAVSYTSGSSIRSSTTLPAIIQNRATALLKEESAVLAEELNQQAGKLLAQYLEDATEYSAEFTTITGAYEELTAKMSSLQKEITAQIESYKKQAADAATQAAKEAAEAATKAAKNAAKEAANAAAEKAGAALKGIMGR